MASNAEDFSEVSTVWSIKAWVESKFKKLMNSRQADTQMFDGPLAILCTSPLELVQP